MLEDDRRPEPDPHRTRERARRRQARFRAELEARGIKALTLRAPIAAHAPLKRAVGLMTREENPLDVAAALRAAGGANEPPTVASDASASVPPPADPTEIAVLHARVAMEERARTTAEAAQAAEVEAHCRTRAEAVKAKEDAATALRRADTAEAAQQAAEARRKADSEAVSRAVGPIGRWFLRRRGITLGEP